MVYQEVKVILIRNKYFSKLAIRFPSELSFLLSQIHGHIHPGRKNNTECI